MYKCQKCGWVSKPGHSCKKIVTRIREKEYNLPFIGRDGKENIKTTKGTEIAQELKVCARCERNFKRENRKNS